MENKTYKDLSKYCYFSSLSDGALEALSKKLSPVEYSAGETIIRENTPAEAFYLVKRGEVEISKNTKWGQSANISVMGSGEGFGEMALLTCSSRACSVIAKTDVSLLKLYKTDFEEVIKVDSVFSKIIGKRIQNYSRFNDIKTLQPFALLAPDKMNALTARLVEQKYSVGDKIINQGEQGDIYYIIKSGRVAVFKKTLEDETEQVATLEEGQGFGEEALITNSPRSATIEAIEDTAVWALSKSDFESIMQTSFLKEVPPEEVLQSDAPVNVLLDVRMDAEYEEERIPGSLHIPLDDLRNRYSELETGKKYFVYCLLGSRSASAAFLMNSQGFNATSIKGGILNWPGPLEEGELGIHTPLKST